MTVQVAMTRAAVETEEVLKEHDQSVRAAVDYLTQRYGWPRTAAERAVYGMIRLGIKRLGSICKVMELVSPYHVSAAHVFQAAGRVYRIPASSLSRVAFFIPAQYRGHRRTPTEGETETVSCPLTSRQIEDVKRILERLAKMEQNLDLPALFDALKPKGAEAEVAATMDAPAELPSAAVPVEVLEADSHTEDRTAAEASELSAAPVEDEREDILADLAVLGNAQIPGFDLETLIRQLAAVARVVARHEAVQAELEQLRAERERLAAANQVLREALTAAEADARARVAAAEEEAARREREAAENLAERRRKLEEAYQALENLVNDFVNLNTLQQVTNLGVFRTRLIQTLNAFGETLKQVRTVA